MYLCRVVVERRNIKSTALHQNEIDVQLGYLILKLQVSSAQHKTTMYPAKGPPVHQMVSLKCAADFAEVDFIRTIFYFYQQSKIKA